MSGQNISVCRCTGGGYIIRAATGKKEDFILVGEKQEKPKDSDRK